MEDPWASGSAWATQSKPAERPASPSSLPSPPALAQSPPARFDVSDPWGTSTAALETPTKEAVTVEWTGDSPKAKAETVGTPGWGGGWGAAESTEDEVVMGEPSQSPARKPQESPEWGFSGAAVIAPEDPTGFELPSEHDNDEAASIPAPISPPARLGSASPRLDEYTFDRPSITALSPPDIGKLTLPTSPSFGDDFGGFASGFGDDPWETKKQDDGWGEGSRRSSSSDPSRRISSENGAHDAIGHEDDDDGWGGSTGRHDSETVKVQQQVGMDQEWEEAQHRIRVTEQRAVSGRTVRALLVTVTDCRPAKRKDRQATEWLEGTCHHIGRGAQFGGLG